MCGNNIYIDHCRPRFGSCLRVINIGDSKREELGKSFVGIIASQQIGDGEQPSESPGFFASLHRGEIRGNLLW